MNVPVAVLRRAVRPVIGLLAVLVLAATATAAVTRTASAAPGDSLVGEWERDGFDNRGLKMRITVTNDLYMRFNYAPQCLPQLMMGIVKVSTNSYEGEIDGVEHSGSCGLASNRGPATATVYESGTKLRISDFRGLVSTWSRLSGGTPSTPPPAATADVAFHLDLLSPGLKGPVVTNGGAFQVAAWVKNLSSTTTAQQVRLPFTLRELSVISANPSAGSFSGSTWTIGSLAPGVERKLTLKLRTASGDGMKAGDISGTVATSSSDPKSDNNKSILTMTSSSGPYAKNGATCGTGAREIDRSYPAQMNAEGRGLPADQSLWGRIFNRPVVRVQMRWTNLCMRSDGALLNNGDYQVSATGLSTAGGRWSVVSEGSVQCQGGSTVRYCTRNIVLRPPSNFNLEVDTAAEIGVEFNSPVVRALDLDVDFASRYRPSTEDIVLPITMGIRAGGCTWAAGGGDSALPGTCP